MNPFKKVLLAGAVALAALGTLSVKPAHAGAGTITQPVMHTTYDSSGYPVLDANCTVTTTANQYSAVRIHSYLSMRRVDDGIVYADFADTDIVVDKTGHTVSLWLNHPSTYPHSTSGSPAYTYSPPTSLSPGAYYAQWDVEVSYDNPTVVVGPKGAILGPQTVMSLNDVGFVIPGGSSAVAPESRMTFDSSRNSGSSLRNDSIQVALSESRDNGALVPQRVRAKFD